MVCALDRPGLWEHRNRRTKRNVKAQACVGCMFKADDGSCLQKLCDVPGSEAENRITRWALTLLERHVMLLAAGIDSSDDQYTLLKNGKGWEYEHGSIV